MELCHHHHHHHHHGGLSRLISPFRALYRKWYIPCLVWLGNAMGGRANAGRLGRISRVVRLLGNLLTLSAIIGVIAIIGVTTFWTGGAALPLWAAILVAAGITINSISEKTELPHGFHAPARKLIMSGVRYAHDVNGAAGTGASWTSTILEAISWLSAGLITFEPVVGSALFVASRGSALVSATGAVGTNQHRLWVYRVSICEKIDEHYQLKAKADNTRHETIQRLVNETMTELNVQGNDKYTDWVKFRCYKAVDAGIGKAPVDDTAVKTALKRTLNPYLKEHKSFWQRCIEIFTSAPSQSGQRFSRHALMRVNGTAGQKISVLDSMPILENSLYNTVSLAVNDSYKIIGDAVDFFYNERLVKKENANLLFVLHLKQALMEQDETKVTKEIVYQTIINCFNYFFTEMPQGKSFLYTLNKKALMDYYPLQGNPHGNQFLIDYHTKKIAQDIGKRIIESLACSQSSIVLTETQIQDGVEMKTGEEELFTAYDLMAPIPESRGQVPPPPTSRNDKIPCKWV